MQDLQEGWIFLVVPISLWVFFLVCSKTRFATPRRVFVFFWGIVHLMPILSIFAGISIDTLNQTIGTLSVCYGAFMGSVLLVVSLVVEPSDKKSFSDGASYPV